MQSPTAFLGLDFGTTNASLSYVLDDPRLAGEQIVEARDVLYPVDPERGQASARVPTLLAADPADPASLEPLTGWACWQHLRRASPEGRLLRHGKDYFRSVKSDLGRCAVYRYAFAPAFTTPEVVAGRILGDLLEEALDQLPGVRREDVAVTLTVPSALSEAARRATLDAATIAGLAPSQVDLIDEPIAALIDLLGSPAAAGLLGEEPKTLALYDYGGGTLDVTVVRACFDPTTRTGLRVHTLAVSPYARLGGDVVDRAVMRQVVMPQLLMAADLGPDDLALDVKQQLEDTFTPWVARGLKEALCRQAATCLKRTGALPSEPFVAFFDIPAPSADLGTGFQSARRFCMESRQFEALLAPLVCWGGASAIGRADQQHPALLEPLVAALDVGRIEPTELDYVVLHGGGCRNPYVRDLLESYVADPTSLFAHTQILQTPDLDASVARGAAISGYWKHARQTTYIVPVIPEEIGVLTLSDRPVKLVDGGAPLPYPAQGGVATAETVFAVPSTGLRRMLVPFYSGRERPCRLVGTVGVDLPPGLEAGDEVRLRLRIDEDKTLHWWFSVKGGPYQKPEAIRDPWAPVAPTGKERELLELRREIRHNLVSCGWMNPYDLLREVGLLLDTGELTEAQLLLDDLGEPDEAHAGNWHNLRGLIASAQGNSELAHAHFLSALEYKPTNAVFLGNLGHTLHKLGRTEDGIARCRAALSLDPNLLYVRNTLASLHRALGAESAAAAELGEGLRIALQAALEDAQKASLQHWVARFHAELGDYREAHEATARAGVAEKNARFGGDHTHRIAGPDSGYVRMVGLP